jgi:hypothetical protein
MDIEDDKKVDIEFLEVRSNADFKLLNIQARETKDYKSLVPLEILGEIPSSTSVTALLLQIEEETKQDAVTVKPSLIQEESSFS